MRSASSARPSASALSATLPMIASPPPSRPEAARPPEAMVVDSSGSSGSIGRSSRIAGMARVAGSPRWLGFDDEGTSPAGLEGGSGSRERASTGALGGGGASSGVRGLAKPSSVEKSSMGICCMVTRAARGADGRESSAS